MNLNRNDTINFALINNKVKYNFASTGAFNRYRVLRHSRKGLIGREKSWY